MTVIKIDQKIASQAVIKGEVKEEVKIIEENAYEIMNEKIGRPELLVGSTYKIKPPTSDNALYITINDIVLNEGTDGEVRQPYEMFINSKAMENYQWVVALTRVISACFRKGGDIAFLVEELTSVYDPNGGYYKKGGTYMPSLVAEIGSVIEKHMKSIGLIKTEELSETTKQVLAEKRAAYEKTQQSDNVSAFPATSTLCAKCHEKAVILMDGCSTCLSCGDGKCS